MLVEAPPLNRDLIFYDQLNPNQQREVLFEADEYIPGKRIEEDCRKCGACCYALDTDFKKNGEPCTHLAIDPSTKTVSCTIYEHRPDVCRQFDCAKLDSRDELRIRELRSARAKIAELFQYNKFTCVLVGLSENKRDTI